MSKIKAYLLSIVAAAFVVSIISMLPQKKSIKKVVTLCGGLFLLLTLLRPVVCLKFDDMEDFLAKNALDETLIEEALADGQNESARLITERTQEYILDKAEALGAAVSAEVTLRALSGSYQYPYSVRLDGTWSQEQKKALGDYIAQTLGIPEERQLWNEAP